MLRLKLTLGGQNCILQVSLVSITRGVFDLGYFKTGAEHTWIYLL